MSITVDEAGQSRAWNRLSASPPRPRACVPDQSVDDGGLPYRWRYSYIAVRTQSRVRVAAIAPGWQRVCSKRRRRPCRRARWSERRSSGRRPGSAP